MMNTDGSGVRQLTHNDAQDWSPGWSPDGTRIAFDSDRYDSSDVNSAYGSSDVVVMNADGSGVRRLTHHDAYNSGGFLVAGRHHDRLQQRPRRRHGDLCDRGRRLAWAFAARHEDGSRHRFHALRQNERVRRFRRYRRRVMSEAVDSFSGEPAGLSTAEVEQRRREGRTNDVPDAPVRTLGEIVRNNVLTPVNAIIGSMFVLIMVAGFPADALFAGVVVSNSVIGIAQELKARRTLHKLAVLSAPRARVVRDGENARGGHQRSRGRRHSGTAARRPGGG